MKNKTTNNIIYQNKSVIEGDNMQNKYKDYFYKKKKLILKHQYINGYYILYKYTTEINLIFGKTNLNMSNE